MKHKYHDRLHNVTSFSENTSQLHLRRIQGVSLLLSQEKKQQKHFFPEEQRFPIAKFVFQHGYLIILGEVQNELSCLCTSFDPTVHIKRLSFATSQLDQTFPASTP